ncbi:MAG: hypothetical protein IPJ88_15515 [Myxococcales bacterium]|nr:MAG: hypothetical protein IPJ88_15515 [Myxococcales bacterium]
MQPFFRSFCFFILIYCSHAFLTAGCVPVADSDQASAKRAMLGAWLPYAEQSVRLKVLVINYDPIVSGGSLREQHFWQDPRELVTGFSEALYQASGGGVAYDIVDWKDVDAFPPMIGEQFNETSYEQCLNDGSSCYNTKNADYEKIVRDHDLCNRVAQREVDEVLLLGAPGFGFFESSMVGRDSFWINGPTVSVSRRSCSRRFVLMGFSYERHVAEMLHDYGHRVDDTLKHVEEAGKLPKGNYEKFSKYLGTSSNGIAGCGDTHHPPNSAAGEEYNYNSPLEVSSTCHAFGPVPDQSFPTTQFDCDHDDGWGCVESEYHKWRFAKLPRTKNENWWKFIAVNSTNFSDGETNPPDVSLINESDDPDLVLVDDTDVDNTSSNSPDDSFVEPLHASTPPPSGNLSCPTHNSHTTGLSFVCEDGLFTQGDEFGQDFGPCKQTADGWVPASSGQLCNGWLCPGSTSENYDLHHAPTGDSLAGLDGHYVCACDPCRGVLTWKLVCDLDGADNYKLPLNGSCG